MFLVFLSICRRLSQTRPVQRAHTEFLEFKNKHFIELLNTQISEIEIYLRTQDGELIEFAGDKDVIVNLEFSNVD